MVFYRFFCVTFLSKESKCQSQIKVLRNFDLPFSFPFAISRNESFVFRWTVRAPDYNKNKNGSVCRSRQQYHIGYNMHLLYIILL